MILIVFDLKSTRGFLSNIQGKGEPAEIALLLIDEGLLDLACETLQSVKNGRTVENHAKTCHRDKAKNDHFR